MTAQTHRNQHVLQRKEQPCWPIAKKQPRLRLSWVPKDPEDFPIVNDRLCRQFPNIVTDDLIALWREAGERQLAEAEELETYARQRLVK